MLYFLSCSYFSSWTTVIMPNRMPRHVTMNTTMSRHWSRAPCGLMVDDAYMRLIWNTKQSRKGIKTMGIVRSFFKYMVNYFLWLLFNLVSNKMIDWLMTKMLVFTFKLASIAKTTKRTRPNVAIKKLIILIVSHVVGTVFFKYMMLFSFNCYSNLDWIDNKIDW